MYRRLPLLLSICAGLCASLCSDAEAAEPAMNLLLNPTFEFHAFDNHRSGTAVSHTCHNVACWNTEAWGNITVAREAHVSPQVRPVYSAGNLVSIRPGKTFWQFVTLAEAGLAHGDRLSLSVDGHQPAPNSLRACIKLMKLDSEDGRWSPAEFGMADKRDFPRHARGELVVAKSYETLSEKEGAVELRIDDAEILGRVTHDKASHSDDINTIGIRVEFENLSADADVWVWWPSLYAGAQAQPRLPAARDMTPYYRHIPRTIQKLWKAEPIHIILMGSSIDRGSANPPMYVYDEDPQSPTFKQPLSDRTFEPEKVGRPDLDGYVGWNQHYFDYAGRLRLELMRKFDLPVSKICLNFMACDGSCVGEAHSGLAQYCSLSIPPNENANGHQSGKTWQELYPGLFERAEGPRPDLVIFGSGANEKTDTPDEVAVYEGMVRWIQRHYPGTEFLFCQFQNAGGYTPNPGDLMALALRYQIPYLDYGKVGDDATRWCNRYALVPSDGHPQAASHYLWFKQLEKAFECWDPVLPGQAQLHLPERAHVNTYGWEGEITTFEHSSPRIKGNMFVFEDTAINCWGSVSEGKPVPWVDGVQLASRRSSPGRDVRNSLFRHGRCTLGDRHILQVTGQDAKLTYVDAKTCPGRRFLGVDHPLWRIGPLPVTEFSSEWGAPCGSKQVTLEPGEGIEIDAVCTDLSVAYADTTEGGRLRVLVDGVERLSRPTNEPFTDQQGREHFMENRKGILGLGFGLHTVRLEAAEGVVSVLGLFTYDSRPNRGAERVLAGIATAGETIPFTAPFRTRPMVLSSGWLRVEPGDITPTQVTFSGEGQGAYQVIGE